VQATVLFNGDGASRRSRAGALLQKLVQNLIRFGLRSSMIAKIKQQPSMAALFNSI
jgi:hypothetical protein